MERRGREGWAGLFSDSETYQIARRGISTKNDNSFITHRNSYNIISHLYIYIRTRISSNGIPARARARETATGRGSIEGEERREGIGSWKIEWKRAESIAILSRSTIIAAYTVAGKFGYRNDDDTTRPLYTREATLGLRLRARTRSACVVISLT